MNKLQAFLKRPHDFLTTAFIWIIIIFLLVYFAQTIFNSTITCKYQEQIVQNQTEYLSLQAKKYDAIRTLGKHWEDSTQLSQSLRVLNDELKQDSIAWKSGAEAMMKDTQMLLDLHMNSIDRQYSVLTLWSAVMMILFLIFSFYAIFKLEDTLRQSKQMVHAFKAEVREMMKNIKKEAKTETLKIVQEAETKNKELQAKAGIIIEDLKEKSEQHLRSLEERANKLIESLSDKAKTGKEKITKESNKQQEVIQLLSEGLKAYNDKEYQTAIEKYQQAIKIDPDNASIYHNWGNTLSRLAQSENSIDIFEQSFQKYKKAVELKPDYPEAYNNWGNAFARMFELNKDEISLEQAIPKYKESLRLNSDYPETHNNLGVTLSELGSLREDTNLIKESFSEFEKTIGLRLDYISAYKNYINAIWKLLRIENNLELYKSKLEKLLFKLESLKKGEGSYNLACLYSLTNEIEKAFEWLEKDLNINSRVSTRSKYEEDEDFSNIKSDSRFKELLDRYYPEDKESDKEK